MEFLFFILSMKNPLSFFERIYILLYRILNKNKIKKGGSPE